MRWPLPLFLILGIGGVHADALPSQVVLPEAFHWVAHPQIPGLSGAWVLGAENAPGLYALRVQLRQGEGIGPHTHPDDRSTTVLQGTLWVAFGESSDWIALPPGAVYLAPAGVVHRVLARDGDVVYQENGIGPTATLMP